MAAFDNAAWIGARTVRPTEAQLTQIDNYDRGLGDVGVSNLWRHTGYFVLQMIKVTSVNNETAYAVAMVAQVPFKIADIQVGCESAASTAATADVEKNPAGAPDTWATMSTGAVDIKTLAGDFVDLPVLDGDEDIAAGDELRLVVISTSAANVIGAQAILHCFRL